MHLKHRPLALNICKYRGISYSIRHHISIDRILCLIVIVNVLSLDWPAGHIVDGHTSSVTVPRTVLVNSLDYYLA